MSRTPLVLVAATVRGWTWLYTLPLDDAAQHARRDEIASDLWEFRHDSTHAGRMTSAFHLLVRAALGVPDDLLWCCEQLPNHPRSVRAFTLVRFVAVIVAASGLVISANRPSLDVTHQLRVNVATTGWAAIETREAGELLVPALSFTLTNLADRPTSAVQVNALFYGGPPDHEGWGGTFTSVVGGRGLAPGATSRAIVVSAQGVNVRDDAGVARRLAVLHVIIPECRVKLFLRHEGRWTLLAEDPIRPALLHQ
jgi:hypothetical protein